MLTAEQMRGARALLGWRQEDLAQASKVGLATIQRLEKGRGPVMANVSTVLRIEEALGKAGIKFLDSDDGGGIGVRFRGD